MVDLFDLDAEESVIGSCLLEIGAIDKVSGFLKPEHFYRDKNQWIFEAMITLDNRAEAINHVTVAHEMGQRLTDVGGMDYLTKCLDSSPTAVSIVHYARIVWRLAVYRALVDSGLKIGQIAQLDKPSVSEAFTKAETELAKLRAEYSLDDDSTIHHAEGIQGYIETQRDVEIKPWLTTPWPSYNKTVRQRNGKVTVIAGPSGMGKTSWCEQVLEYGARDLGKNGVYYFNELDPTDIFNRRACRLMTTRQGLAPNIHDLEDGIYAETDEMAAFVQDVICWPGKTTLVPCPGWSVYRICSDIRQKAAQGLADFVVLDYIQLIPREDMGRKGATDARAMGLVLQTLKTACQTIPGQPPLIVASQVNRSLKSKDDCRLEALRESGEIGEYANVVTFVFNQWDSTKGGCLQGCKYVPRGDDKCLRRCVYLMTVKNTFGPKGEVLLRQIPHRYQFVEDTTQNQTSWPQKY
jgi:replicative DNA helicase